MLIDACSFVARFLLLPEVAVASSEPSHTFILIAGCGIPTGRRQTLFC